jgi:hypothetical protein
MRRHLRVDRSRDARDPRCMGAPGGGQTIPLRNAEVIRGTCAGGRARPTSMAQAHPLISAAMRLAISPVGYASVAKFVQPPAASVALHSQESTTLVPEFSGSYLGTSHAAPELAQQQSHHAARHARTGDRVHGCAQVAREGRIECLAAGVSAVMPPWRARLGYVPRRAVFRPLVFRHGRLISLTPVARSAAGGSRSTTSSAGGALHVQAHCAQQRRRVQPATAGHAAGWASGRPQRSPVSRA